MINAVYINKNLKLKKILSKEIVIRIEETNQTNSYTDNVGYMINDKVLKNTK